MVFTTLTKGRAGRLLNDGNWRRQTWWPTVDSAYYLDDDGERRPVPPHPPHSTRRTCASWRVQRGVSPDSVVPARPTNRGGRARGLSGDYFRPLLMAVTSSPFAVSPLNSQKNAPPRPWLLAHAILVPTVAGVS